MKVNVIKFSEDFNLHNFGAKGWKNSKSIDCPFCGGKWDKFGILFLENGGVFKCFRCDKKGSIFHLLQKLNRLDLILDRDNDNFSYQDKLNSFLQIQNIQQRDVEIKPVKLPLGFKAIEYDSYLESRGWTNDDYKKFNVGISNIGSRFKDKNIFILKENNEIVGYLSRSKLSKEWHKENIRKAKNGEVELVLRYDNCKDTEFEKVLGGIDDVIIGETKTVIIVEGIMDKQNADKILCLDEGPEVKCVFTFGCHLSDFQMFKLLNKGVENIILMFDRLTIQQTKNSSLKMLRFFNIFISELITDKDPGEMSLAEFEQSLNQLKNPIDFFANRLEKINLK